MATLEKPDFWAKLRWFAPLTIVLVVMPATLLLFHLIFGIALGLTSSTLILLLVTVFCSLGSGVNVSIILSLESSLFLNYYLTRPFHSFRVATRDDILTLVIFIVASTSVSALIKLLTTKQKEIESLIARLEKLTKTDTKLVSNNYQLGSWSIDLEKKVISRENSPSEILHLTPIEWRILEVLILAEGGLVTQKQLLKAVWGEKYGSETNYLRLYMSQLRKKIEDSPKRPNLLLTEPGNGYRALAKRSGSLR